MSNNLLSEEGRGRKFKMTDTLGFPGGSAGKESACNVGDLGSNPGLGRVPGERNGYYSSILAWRIPWTIHGVTKSQTRLCNFH